jgi:predicted Zn finger-like uncharacterized protein
MLLKCPQCQTVLRFEGEPVAGKEVKCPKCSRSFALLVGRSQPPMSVVPPVHIGSAAPVKNVTSAQSLERHCPDCGNSLTYRGREWGGWLLVLAIPLLLVFVLPGSLRLAGGFLGLLIGVAIAIRAMFQRDWECEKCGLWVITRTKRSWQQASLAGNCPICSETLHPAKWAFVGISVLYLIVGISCGVLALRTLGIVLQERSFIFLIPLGFNAVFCALGLGAALWRFSGSVQGCSHCQFYIYKKRKKQKEDVSATGT